MSTRLTALCCFSQQVAGRYINHLRAAAFGGALWTCFSTLVLEALDAKQETIPARVMLAATPCVRSQLEHRAAQSQLASLLVLAAADGSVLLSEHSPPVALR